MPREVLQECQKRQTGYEWDFETLDEYGDIVDHDHYAGLKECPYSLADLGDLLELCLVRDSGTEADGLDDRQWSYLEDGELPAEFDGGNKVPAKYLKEFKAWAAV